MSPVYQCLRQWRRRLWFRSWIQANVWAAWLVGVLGLGFGWIRWLQGQPPWTGIEWGLGIAAIPLLAALATLRESWDWSAIARQADELGGTRDRFQSFIEFTQAPHRSPLRTLAVTETETYAQTLPSFSFFYRPKGLRGLFFLLMATLALSAGYSIWFAGTRDSHRMATDVLRQAVPEIQAVLEKWPEPKLDQSLREVREQLTALNETVSRQPRRDALEAISRSEAAARAVGEHFSELQQVAEALANASEASEFREALREENYARAAEIARQQPAEEMQRVIERARRLKSLPALNSLADRANPGEEVSKMLQKTAQVAQQNQAMERLLASLQDLKFQSGGGKSESPSLTAQAQGTDAPTAQLNAVSPEERAPSRVASTAGSEGKGEADGGGTGADSTPTATDSSPLEAGRKERLPSKLGPGESLQDRVWSSGNDSDAKQRYREIYQAAQADESAAVERENLPTSSRRLVKRYLESIRP